MSMLLMVKAMQTKVGNPLRKLVLIKLADNANDNGECWPSYNHIADQCEISRRSVVSHVNKLEQMGFLTKEYRKGIKGNSTNIFHLSIPSESVAPSAGAALPSANAAPPPSAGAAPRTSHSLETVNEPNNIVQNPVDDAFDYFWLNMVLPKKSKDKAKQAFAKKVKELKVEPMLFASELVKDTKRRKDDFGFDRLHPSTYLNGKRWEDEPDKPSQQQPQTRQDKYDQEMDALLDQQFQQRGLL